MNTIDNLMDEEGENQALRIFLAYYGGACGVSVGKMQAHLRMAGFNGAWPEWCNEPNEDRQHLTKAGAQLWIRHLISLEALAQQIDISQERAQKSAENVQVTQLFAYWYDSYPNGEPSYQETFEAGFKAAQPAREPLTPQQYNIALCGVDMRPSQYEAATRAIELAHRIWSQG